MLNKPFRIKSYVCHGRATPAQKRAYQEIWPRVALAGPVDLTQAFGRVAPRFLEIGFGGGESLITLAQSQPGHDFIGIETHKPGIGSLCLGIQAHALTNVRVFQGDALDILEKYIAEGSLAGAQLFFPDPWPKRRHHARRLLQLEFLRLLGSRLQAGGTLHFATDWEDYACHAEAVFSQAQQWKMITTERSIRRPVLTKFERRAMREGRKVWDFQLYIDP